VEVPYSDPGNPDGGSYGNRVAPLAQTLDILWDEFEAWERDSIISVCVRDLATYDEYQLGLRQVMTIPRWRHGNNWLSNKGGDLLSAAIVFNGHPLYPDANEDIDKVRYRVLTYEHSLIAREWGDPEGANLEGTYYGTVGLKHLIPLMHALSRWDGVNYFNDERWKPSMERIGSYFSYELLPAPRDPGPALPRSKYFPERGLVYIRTSNVWADQNDIQFSFTAAPAFNPSTGAFSLKHDQPDKNSITLSAYGNDFIVDVGYPGQLPKDQNYFLIDGIGQAPAAYAGGENDGRIVQYSTSSTFDFVHGDARSAFDTHYYTGQDGNPVSVVDPTNAVLNADRYVMSVRPAPSTRHFFVVADDIRKDNSLHFYKWVFNSYFSVSGTNPVIIYGSSGKLLKIWSTAQGSVQVCSELMQLEPLQPHPPGEPLPDSPPEQVYNHGLCVSSVNPYFHVLLLPYNAGDPDPVAVTNPTVANGSCFKVEWIDYEDYSVFKHSGTVSSALITTDAKLSQIRKLKSTSLPTDFAMAEGTHLTFDSRLLVDLSVRGVR
jgi:hypothetical protein